MTRDFPVLFVILALLALLPRRATAEDPVAAPAKTPVVVELFSSQG